MSVETERELWALDRVLGDLMRWQFGALLMARAGWKGADPGFVALAVQDFRRRILGACLRHAGLDPGSLAGIQGDAASWEPVLVGEFMAALAALAPLGPAEAALTRFAHGQYFKYSRRVAMLLGIERKLPCAYARR